MDTKRNLTLITLAVVAIYNYLFWKETPGINLPLFSIVLIALMVFLRRSIIVRTNWQVAAICNLLTGGAVMWFGGSLAVAMHLVTITLIITFSWPENVKSPFKGIINFIISAINQAIDLLKSIKTEISKRRIGRIAIYLFKIFIFPVIVFLFYIGIYSESNKAFASIFEDFFKNLSEILQSFFDTVNVPWMVFIFTGTIITLMMLGKKTAANGLHIFSDESDDLFRKRKTKRATRSSLPTVITYHPAVALNALRRTNQSGLILLIGVNLLLLLFNVTDIRDNWFGFSVPDQFSMKNFVHTATWYLVISILASIAILLYYFRGNINFYKNNKAIKVLSYIWITQNLILGVSVFLRNMHYIQYHGLAYKRIGILIFLILVVVGLFTLVHKIKSRKSTHWILKANSYSVLMVLSLASLSNWDLTIAKYNLAHSNPSEIDSDFYLQLNPGVYPLLYEHLDVIENQMKLHQLKPTRWVNITTMTEFKKRLDEKTNYFLERQDELSWPSYTVADANAQKWLNEHKSEINLLTSIQ